jgi:hypothetical protein
MATVGRKGLKAAHVRSVDRAKKLLADEAAAVIKEMLFAAADELEESGVPNASAIFKPREWDEYLKAALGPRIARIMSWGAMSEIEILRATKATQAAEFIERYGIDGADFPTEMPQELIDAIAEALKDSFERTYWANINGKTRADLEKLLTSGVPNGLSISQLAAEIRKFAPAYSRGRAVAIARTESSRSLNQGHVLGIQHVEQETGLLLGKSWLSVQGATTRATHRALDGVTVASGGRFNLGGHECQFPSDPTLPPAESINCLCSIVVGALEVA